MSFLSFKEQKQFEFCRQLFAKTQPQMAYRLALPEAFSLFPSFDREAAKELSALSLEQVDVLYVYGIKYFAIYYAAKKWLENSQERQIVFIEDNEEVLTQFFLQKAALNLLQNSQVALYFLPEFQKVKEVLGEIFWDFALKQMAFIRFFEKDEERFEELKMAIAYESAVKNAGIDEYLRYGISFFQNFYPNLLQIAESFDGAAHFGRYEGIPAIICGAGPSLEKNVNELASLVDKAILFGGGSALNALSARGILPHFGIGVDPNPAQKLRLESNLAYEVPVFYRNRMHFEAFSLIHGPRLYVRGSGGYDIADFIDEELGLFGEWIDEGHNVVNFGLELAYKMGCDPIILTGVDLGFTDLQAYISGIEEDARVAIEQITNTGDFDKDAIKREDIYGRPLYTLWKWVAESRWITEFSKAHPDIKILNATEGGLGMEGVENISLTNAKERYFLHSYDLSGMIFSHIAKSKIAVTQEQVFSLVKRLEQSFSRCIKNLIVLQEENDNLKKELSVSKKVPNPLQSGKGALAEIELNEELAYEYILDLFHTVFSKLMNRKVRALYAQKETMEEWEFEKKKADLSGEKLLFLQKVAAVNKKIIEDAVKRALEEKHEKPL